MVIETKQGASMKTTKSLVDLLCEAFVEVLEGINGPADIHRETGLPYHRCEQLYDLYLLAQLGEEGLPPEKAKTILLRQMWINQPSTLQPDHKWHGTNVYAAPKVEGEDYTDVWSLTESGMIGRMAELSLSPGWVKK
jgi:hypothetical protein